MSFNQIPGIFVFADLSFLLIALSGLPIFFSCDLANFSFALRWWSVCTIVDGTRYAGAGRNGVCFWENIGVERGERLASNR